jgi:uncharacterized protein (TIGR02271 family)
MTNTLVALYDDMDTAHKVVRELRDAGISNDRISLVAHDVSGEYGRQLGGERARTDTGGDGAATGAGIGAVVGGIGGLLVGLGALAIPGIGPVIAAGSLGTALSALLGAGAGALAGGVAGGLIGALVDMGVPEEEAGYYAEGVRRGGALLTVEAEDTDVSRVRDLMNRHHPVDVQQRAQAWRQAGWTGYDAKAKPYSAAQITQERQQYQQTQQPQKTRREDEVRMPVVEEKLAVGKREVETGGVRVHRRVTERPVEEDVTLRKERVNVERRPVDRPATPGMMDTFREGEVEVRATSEEPVVEKRARVTEEVVVNKDVEQHTERVRDTVRRSDVEVEKINAGDLERYRTGWRGHYQTQFASTGNKYEHYEPAYMYGYTLRNEPRYRDYDWTRLEPEARRTWEQRNPGTAWDQIKDAVRYSWENFKARVRD